MSKRSMNAWGGLCGFFGLIVCLFGIGAGLILGNFTWSIVVLHLVCGALLLVAWFLYSGSQGIGTMSKSGFGRKARFGASASIYTLIFVALLVVTNVIALKRDRRWDLTEQGVYSLAPQTTNLLGELDKPLKLVAFRGAGMPGEDESIDQLFQLYAYSNRDKVVTEMINARAKPHLVDVYGMKRGNRVYIEYGEGETKAVSRINEVSEEAVTNAILKLTRGAAKKIYFLQGYGGPSIDDTGPEGMSRLKDAIGDEHFTIEGMFLGEKGKVPEDAAALILVAPQQNLPANERDLLVKYVEQGGRLVLLAEPQGSDEIKLIADRFGIEIGANVVVDLTSRMLGQGPLIVIAPQFGNHVTTKGLEGSQRGALLFGVASSVQQKSAQQSSPATEGATYTTLVSSTTNSWGETDLQKLFDPSEPSTERDDKDLAGPVPLAVSYEKKIAESATTSDASDKASSQGTFSKSARVVVVGDASFAQNEMLSLYGNRAFALNVLGWLAGEEGGVSIASRSIRSSVAPISRDQFLTILTSSLIIPEFLLLMGLFVWWRRKTVEAAGA